MGGKRFEIEPANGKWLGVCAGIANQTGLDVTVVRIGVVLVTLCGLFPWTLLAYSIAYMAGRPERSGRVPAHAVSRAEARERMRSLDLRMQAIETHVTSSNSRLAREIEALR